MITWLLTTLLSGFGFFLSLGLGTQWYLAWIAPAPVLWYAFSGGRAGATFCSAFASYALGLLNLLIAYGPMMPAAVLVLMICVPALVYSLTLVTARLVYVQLGAVAGVLTFATGFAAGDFLLSFIPAGGAAVSPANVQVDMPVVAQAAALGGFAMVTFLIGLFAAMLAEGARRRSPIWLLAASTVFVLNLSLGLLHMSRQSESSMRVALMASNDLADHPGRFEELHAKQIFADYAAGVHALEGKDVALVVLPENIVSLAPQWSEAALAPLSQAASEIGTTVMVGYNAVYDGSRHNVVTAFGADGSSITYAKRHLVEGLETWYLTPGTRSAVLAQGIEPEICKDLDFQATIRNDAVTNRPKMFAAPGWDFSIDGWSHARSAIMRSIETGTPLARSARDGLLTLNDRYGQLLAKKTVGSALTVLIGDLPLADPGGNTVYTRCGDLFSWACLGAALVFTLAAIARRPQAKADPLKPTTVPL